MSKAMVTANGETPTYLSPADSHSGVLNSESEHKAR